MVAFDLRLRRRHHQHPVQGQRGLQRPQRQAEQRRLQGLLRAQRPEEADHGLRLRRRPEYHPPRDARPGLRGQGDDLAQHQEVPRRRHDVLRLHHLQRPRDGHDARRARPQRDEQGRKRVIQRRFNVSVPRARVPEKAPTVRDRSEG